MKNDNKCECCGEASEELTQVDTLPGIVDGGVYRSRWVCDDCAAPTDGE
jgi:hypothetical protein